MLGTDRDALICDMAETYGVLDMRALPVPLLATLASGLGDESRIKMKLSGQKVKLDTLLLAMSADMLNFLAWGQTEDGIHNRNRPESFTNLLLGKPPKKDKPKNKYRVFKTSEDFKRAWNSL